MSHQVLIEPAGRSFAADPGEPVLDAALREGISLPYGCMSGTCRSCRARVVSGEISYPAGEPEALTDEDRAYGFALLCSAHAAGDLRLEVEEIDTTGEIVVRTLPARVVAKRMLAHDVVGLTLQLPAGERLRFRAGQYLDILLRDGRRRSFSLASAPGADGGLELQVRRVPGGAFSDYAFSHLKERALLRVRGPLGSFYLRKDRGLPVVLVAGGTGFAPVKSIVEDAFDEGFDRPMHLYWGVRARRDLYMDELARGWAESRDGFRYTPVLSEPEGEDAWEGRTGLVHEVVLEDHPDLGGHVVYMSGPPPMVEAGRSAFVARGVEPTDIHADAFDYAHDADIDG